MNHKKIKVVNPTGFDVLSAGKICDMASRYEKCEISISCGRNLANAKSFLQVLAAGIKYGDEITIICDGEEEETVIEEMISFIQKELVK